MKLRSALMLLAAGSVLPLCIFAVAAVVMLVEHDRETMKRESMGRVVSAMSAVDAELRGSIASLRALGASKALENGDLRTFYDEARRVLATQRHWRNVGLATASRRQLMDAVLPFDAPAPFGNDNAFDRAIETHQPVVSDVVPGTAVPSASVRIRLPVVIDGSVRYVLSVPLDPAMFEQLLAAQHLPEGWAIGLVDRNRRFVARIPEAAPGSSVSADFGAALERAPQGWFRGRTIEGTDTFTPYVTSPVSGWALGIAIPTKTIDAAAWRTLTIAVSGMLLAIACAIGLAWLMARRIAAPIASLANATEAMGRGDDMDVRDPGRIEEVRRLQGALVHASAAIRERQQSASSEKAALEREQRALQSADAAKNEFIATLSHELRNPLGALTAAAQVLKAVQIDNAVAVQARDIIERQVRQMGRLIEDLLDVSRVAAGKANLKPEVFDLSDLARQLIDAWSAGGRFASHDVRFDAEPVLVYADRARMEQVLANLVDNALKFTRRGGAIRVTVGRDGAQAQMKVSDEGEGIEPGDLARIFDLFAQGRAGSRRKEGGLGIGLAMVKRLLEIQGGSVEASSAGAGKGATFTARIPAVEPLRAVASDPEPTVAITRMARPRRILVIDDNEDARRMLHAILALGGHDVRDSPDGASGLALAAQIRPDVVFVDIGLPDIDGYKVARHLRAAQRDDGPILIAVSGYGQPEDRRRALDAGFDMYLTKPVTVEALEQAMLAVAESRRPDAPSGRVA